MSNLGLTSAYSFGGFTLDSACRTLSRDGQDIPLAPKEFQTLSLLVKSAGQAVPRETLIAAVWPDTAVSDNSLARAISSLRHHLGADAIEVVSKFGYRFAIPVTLAEAPTTRTFTPRPVSLWQKSANRFWGAAAVALLVAGLLATRLITPKPATAAAPPLTWTDPQTNLIWAGKDNGTDVNREQAIEFCRNLTLDSRRDWRLPTIDELQTLNDPGTSIPGIWGPVRPVYWHVKGNLRLTGGESASDLNGEGSEQSYDFSFGRRNYDPTTFNGDHRALCVRHSAPR